MQPRFAVIVHRPDGAHILAFDLNQQAVPRYCGELDAVRRELLELHDRLLADDHAGSRLTFHVAYIEDDGKLGPWLDVSRNWFRDYDWAVMREQHQSKNKGGRPKRRGDT